MAASAAAPGTPPQLETENQDEPKIKLEPGLQDTQSTSALSREGEVVAETQVEPKAEPKEEPPPDEGGLFQCYLCGMAERYHGHGFSVPFARAIVFNEDAYVMRDPFTPYAANAFLCLGAPCSLCSQLVCLSCSLFYSKRFCSPCGQQHVKQFPVEVQKKIRELTNRVQSK